MEMTKNYTNMDNGSTAYVRLSNINRTDFDMYTYTKCNAYNCIAVFWLGFPYLPDVNTRKMFKKYSGHLVKIVQS